MKVISPLHTPAQILVGAPLVTHDIIIASLQKEFCKDNGCGVCSVCFQIRQHQFYANTWVVPEKNYTLDDLEIIFSTTCFALDKNQHHYFIITLADLLSPACSNSLLKLIEEPPQGYHFIFLTNRLYSLLPTIRSRCIVHTTSADTGSSLQSNFIDYFKKLDFSGPSQFLKTLDQAAITEQESLLIMDDLIKYWMNKSKKAIQENDEGAFSKTQYIVMHLQQALQEPPMPGSSKLFWRNLFLKLSN